jgi:DNA-binding PucR family transcriptional regulator
MWTDAGVDLGPACRLLGDVPERSPACEALITRVAARIELHTDAIAERLVDRIAHEMDLVREDEDVRDDLLAVARACASLLTSMTRTWSDPRAVPPPEDALAWSRSFGSRRLPMGALLRVFRIGQSGYREVWHRELAASGEDPALILEALKATSAFTFTWVDAILEPVTATYEEERERGMRGAHAVRAETVEAILSGQPLDATRAGARLGYELERPHMAYIAWVETDAGEAARDSIEQLAPAVAALLGGPEARRPLLLRVAPRVVHGWVPHGAIGGGTLEAVRRLLADTGVRVAVGRTVAGVEGFRCSHEEARRARRVARLLRRSAAVTRYEDVAVADLLTRDPDVARDVVRAALGPLAVDDDSSRRLIATLRVFLQEGQSFSRAARRLGIHENTVAYRVRRVLELTGQQDAGSLVLRAAVELVPLLQADDHDDDVLLVEPTVRRGSGSG